MGETTGQSCLLTLLLGDEDVLLRESLMLCEFLKFLQGLRVFLGGPPCGAGAR